MAGGDVEGVLVEGTVVDAAILIGGAGEDELDATGLVEDLESGFGADEEVTVGGGALAVEGVAARVGGALGVEVGLFVGEGSVLLNGVGVDEGAVELADEEEGLVGAHADAVEAFEIIDAAGLFGFEVDVPDFSFGGVGEVEVTAV